MTAEIIQHPNSNDCTEVSQNFEEVTVTIKNNEGKSITYADAIFWLERMKMTLFIQAERLAREP